MAVASLKSQLSRFEIRDVRGLSDQDKKEEGAGSFGSVYEVSVKGVPRIAKQLHGVLIGPDVRPDQKQGIYERFYKECLLLSGLDHPNIVKFVGVHFGSSQKEFDASLIMERLHTDLEKYLDLKQHPNVPIPQKLSILLDVSSGLVYLHNQNPSIIHRDLTTGNILLTEDLQAKIADLGVSRVLDISPNILAAQTKCPGTLAYMPPEALQEQPVYGKALDVFSFGEVCLCTIHQQFAEVFDVTNCSEMPAALQRKEVEILKRKKWFDTMPADHCLRQLTTSCLRDRPKERPTTQQLHEMMKELCIGNWKATIANPRSAETPLLELENQIQQGFVQRNHLLEELESQRLMAQMYADEFVAERKDREQAHSRIAEMETRYNHQIQSLANELQTKTKELEEEIQSKTQQVKQYKKQVDRFRDEVNAGKQQAEMLQVQVQKLQQENEKMSAWLYHMHSHNDERLRKENQDIKRQLLSYLEKVNDLSAKNHKVLSEFYMYKERRFQVSTSPPASPKSRYSHDNGVPASPTLYGSSQPIHTPQHSHGRRANSIGYEHSPYQECPPQSGYVSPSQHTLSQQRAHSYDNVRMSQTSAAPNPTTGQFGNYPPQSGYVSPSHTQLSQQRAHSYDNVRMYHQSQTSAAPNPTTSQFGNYGHPQSKPLAAPYSVEPTSESGCVSSNHDRILNRQRAHSYDNMPQTYEQSQTPYRAGPTPASQFSHQQSQPLAAPYSVAPTSLSQFGNQSQ